MWTHTCVMSPAVSRPGHLALTLTIGEEPFLGRDPCITLWWPLTSNSHFNYSLCNRQHRGYNLCSNISKLYSSSVSARGRRGGGGGCDGPLSSNPLWIDYYFSDPSLWGESFQCDFKHQHQLTWSSHVFCKQAALHCQRWQMGSE